MNETWCVNSSIYIYYPSHQEKDILNIRAESLAVTTLGPLKLFHHNNDDVIEVNETLSEVQIQAGVIRTIYILYGGTRAT